MSMIMIHGLDQEVIFVKHYKRNLNIEINGRRKITIIVIIIYIVYKLIVSNTNLYFKDTIDTSPIALDDIGDVSFDIVSIDIDSVDDSIDIDSISINIDIMTKKESKSLFIKLSFILIFQRFLLSNLVIFIS